MTINEITEMMNRVGIMIPTRLSMYPSMMASAAVINPLIIAQLSLRGAAAPKQSLDFQV
jgi:hypothetical protein